MSKSDTFTDAEIIDRILAGEKSLYELIVRRFNPYLYKVGRSYRYSHEDTQDLMQDTYIDAFKNLAQYQGRSEFRTWLIRIMLNNCHRKRSRSSFKNEVAQTVNEQATPMFANKDQDTDRVIQGRELQHVIERALLDIPIEYRIVFSLREINGLNVAETAEVLNLTESNVKVRLNRAKTMLRTEIESTYTKHELFEFNLVYCERIVEYVMARLGSSGIR